MKPSRASLLNAAFRTDRLILEPLTADHADLLWRPMQDPRIYRWLSLRPPVSVVWLRERWGGRESRLSPNGDEAWLGWAVRRQRDGLYVGKADANVDEGNVATNVGYLFFPGDWGRGFATEATRGIALHLEAQGVTELRATVTVGNAASGRVLEKAGFVRAELLPGHHVIRGSAHDAARYVRRAPGPSSR